MKKIKNSPSKKVSFSFFDLIFDKFFSKQKTNIKIKRKAEKQLKSEIKTKKTIKTSEIAKEQPISKNSSPSFPDENIKREFKKFPIETIQAFESCGYEITEMFTRYPRDNRLLERLSTITKEFNYNELKEMAFNSDKIYGIGEFLTGSHEEVGLTSEKYIELLKKMTA